MCSNRTFGLFSDAKIELIGGEWRDFGYGTQVVVKTSVMGPGGAGDSALEYEASVMKALGRRGDTHLVRALMHREPGALYLEFVEGGDLMDQWDKRAHPRMLEETGEDPKL